MHALTEPASITFDVDDVEQQRQPLPQAPLHESLRQWLGTPIESCCDYHINVCAGLDYHPLLAAVYTAYSLHRPLILSPDAVWLTIAQGLAHHMAVEGERLRERFVAHHGRLELVFTCREWIAGTPENPWSEAFESWANQVRDHVGDTLHDALMCDFSTTTPAARAASRIVMMDIFRRYFRYQLCIICGIPTITLRGTPDDWQRVADKVELLEPFDMPWWLEHLRPIAAQFVRASTGDVDRSHWQNICKLKHAYGGSIINGWVARLFPYLYGGFDGPYSRRNPIFRSGEGFQTDRAPSGLSHVQFLWKDLNKTLV